MSLVIPPFVKNVVFCLNTRCISSLHTEVSATMVSGRSWSIRYSNGSKSFLCSDV